MRSCSSVRAVFFFFAPDDPCLLDLPEKSLPLEADHLLLLIFEEPLPEGRLVRTDGGVLDFFA